MNQTFRAIRADYPPDQDTDQMTGISWNISRALKQRLYRTNYCMFESGISMQPLSPTRVMNLQGKWAKYGVRIGRLIQCFDTVFSGERVRRETTTRALPLSACGPVFDLLISLLVIGFVSLLFEILILRQQRRHSRRQRRHQKTRDQVKQDHQRQHERI